MTDTFPCRENGHFDCAAFEGGPCQGEKFAREAMLEAHESHERLDPDCPECQRMFDEASDYHRALFRGADIGMDEHDRVAEAARDRADWILMEDR